MPNRKNVIPNPRTIKKTKNILSEAANKQFKIIEPEKKEEEIVKNIQIDNNKLEYSPNLFTQASAKNILVNTLLNTV